MRNNLIASFVLRLRDQISGPLGAIRRRMEGLRRLAGTVALIGGALAGAALASPIRQAAALEGQVRAIGITAGLSGQQLAQFTQNNIRFFEDVARATNQRQQDIARGSGILVAAGGRVGEAWEALTPIIVSVATASGASVDDIAQTTVALVNNLRVGVDELPQSLAALAQAGKEGQFELRDMAREFASLTAQAAALGMTGPGAVASLAAALQVARQGAGTAGEAATNLRAFLRSVVSPDAIRSFRELGVDIEGVLREASARAMNPLEVLVQKVREVTGDDPIRIRDLFGRAEAVDFLQPMIANVREYMRIRDAAGAASAGLIDTDRQSAMEGLAAAVRRLTLAWDEFANLVGRAATGPLTVLGDALFRALDGVRAVEEAMPGTTDALGGAAAALVGTAGLIAAVKALSGLLAAGGPLLLGLAALAAAAALIAANFARIRAAVASAGEAIERFFARRAELTAAEPAAPGPAQQRQRLFRENPTGGFYSPEQNAEIARLLGDLGPPRTAPERAQVEVTVRATPGAEVVGVETTSPNLRVTAPDRGTTRGRP